MICSVNLTGYIQCNIVNAIQPRVVFSMSRSLDKCCALLSKEEVGTWIQDGVGIEGNDCCMSQSFFATDLHIFWFFSSNGCRSAHSMSCLPLFLACISELCVFLISPISRMRFPNQSQSTCMINLYVYPVSPIQFNLH